MTDRIALTICVLVSWGCAQPGDGVSSETGEAPPQGDDGSAGGGSGDDGAGDDGTADGGAGDDGSSGDDGAGDTGEPAPIDEDLDGFTTTDCDDSDASVFPGAAETCNGTDDDCDGIIDDEPIDGTLYYVDADGDGFGTEEATITACEPPSDTSTVAGDCDDASVQIHPGALESCEGPLDLDCDGTPHTGCTTVDTTDAETVIEGTPASSPYVTLFGKSVTAVGDVTGDGAPDFAAASMTQAFYFDSASVVPGFADATDASAFVVTHGTEGSFSEVTSTPAIGDLDGDGNDDLALTDVVYSNNGAAFITYGPVTADFDSEDADVVLLAEGYGFDFAFWDLQALDFDGDGNQDLLAGAPYAPSLSTAEGSTYVFLGPFASTWTTAGTASVILTGEADGDLSGTTTAALGDLDGDGIDDLGSAAPGHDDGANADVGAVYLLCGEASPTATGTLASYDGRIVGVTAGQALGQRALSPAGDQNGDGLADFAVSDTMGFTHVFEGPSASALTTADAVATLHAFDGGSYMDLNVTDDLDLDGTNDLLVTARDNLYVVLGPLSGTKDLTVSGEADLTISSTLGDLTGATLIGDQDGDGHEELAVGAMYYDSSTTSEVGATLVFDGFSLAARFAP